MRDFRLSMRRLRGSSFSLGDLSGLMALFDARDMESMFSDTAGQVPIVPGQVVAMALSNNAGRMLGPELSTAPSKSNTVANDFAYAGLKMPTVDKRFYSFAYEVRATGDPSRYRLSGFGDSILPSQQVSWDIYNSGDFVTGVWVPYSGTVQAINVETEFGVRSNPEGGVGTVTIEYRNLTFREMAGNHALQSNFAARPLLQQSGDVHYLSRDPVDDVLPWFAPAGTFTEYHLALDGTVTVREVVQGAPAAINILRAETTVGYVAYVGTHTLDERASVTKLLKGWV